VQRRRMMPGLHQHPLRPAPLLIDLWGSSFPGTCSYLEAIRAEKGHMPMGLEHRQPERYADYDGPTMDEATMERLAPYLKKYPHACPFPMMDPVLYNAGETESILLYTQGQRLRELLADGQWHSYTEVMEVAGVPRPYWAPRWKEIHEIAVWGDVPYRRDWQVPVYCYGHADASGMYARWDAPVALAHRLARRLTWRTRQLPAPHEGWALQLVDFAGAVYQLRDSVGKAHGPLFLEGGRLLVGAKRCTCGNADNHSPLAHVPNDYSEGCVWEVARRLAVEWHQATESRRLDA
jgi:hypothetical protein